VTPLYTEADARAVANHLRPVPYGTPVEPGQRISATFLDAGHILGSAIVVVDVRDDGRSRRLAFSGDLGHKGLPIVRDPATVDRADLVVMESTYGNRVHKGMKESIDEFAHALNDTLRRKGGNVIIPAFAVGRAQDVLYVLADLTRKKRIEGVTVYVDSPLAIEASRITMRNDKVFDEEAKDLREVVLANPDALKVVFTRDAQESMALNSIRGGAVIMAGSGMCTAGRSSTTSAQPVAQGQQPRDRRVPGAGDPRARIVDGAKRVRVLGRTSRWRPTSTRSAGCRPTRTGRTCWPGRADSSRSPGRPGDPRRGVRVAGVRRHLEVPPGMERAGAQARGADRLLTGRRAWRDRGKETGKVARGRKMSLLVVGSMAFDSIKSPFGEVEKVVVGSATISPSRRATSPRSVSFRRRARFPRLTIEKLSSRGIDLRGLKIADGETFRWKGYYDYDLNTAHTVRTDLNVFKDFVPTSGRMEDTPYVFLGTSIPASSSTSWPRSQPEGRRPRHDELLDREEPAAPAGSRAKVDVLVVNEAEVRQLTGEFNLVGPPGC
jgi:hypothetical protein